jgi:hypothetical protein
MSALTAFTKQLINFFEELSKTFPEERDIIMATEAIKEAKKVNPRLILDLFNEHVYNDFAEAIKREDIDYIRRVAHSKIQTHFNEMLSALTIFEKHWNSMGTENQNVIWKYLKVLCVLSEKSREN